MFPHNLFSLAPRAKSVRESKGHAVGGASFRRGGRWSSPLLFSTLVFATLGANAALAALSTTSGPSATASTLAADREALANLPSATRGAAVAATDSAIIVTGGDEHGALNGRVDRLDLATGEWTRLTEAVVPRRFGAAVLVGEWLVIAGGRNDVGPEATTELVNIRTAEVLVGAPLPTPRWNAGMALHKGLVYVAGGTHGWARLEVVEAYDIEDDRWLAQPSLTVERDAGLVEIDGALYAIGGYAGKGKGATRVVEQLIEDDDQPPHFAVVGALAMPMSAFGIAAQKGRAVLFGDFANASHVVAFTPSTGATDLVKTTFTPRRQAAAVATDEGYVVVGGRLVSGQLSSTVERIRLR